MLQAEFTHKVIVRDAAIFATRFSRRTDVFLILKRLHRTVKELGRNHHSPATHPTRGDLDRLTLRSSNVVTLLATELGKSYRGHA